MTHLDKRPPGNAVARKLSPRRSDAVVTCPSCPKAQTRILSLCCSAASHVCAIFTGITRLPQVLSVRHIGAYWVKRACGSRGNYSTGFSSTRQWPATENGDCRRWRSGDQSAATGYYTTAHYFPLSNSRGSGATPTGHVCYLRTVRSWPLADGFPLLGFPPPRLPCVKLRVCISTPPRVCVVPANSGFNCGKHSQWELSFEQVGLLRQRECPVFVDRQ
jgi:hypothetical protein